MHEPTDPPERDVDRRIEQIKTQIGELVVEHDRLHAQRGGTTPQTQGPGDRATGAADGVPSTTAADESADNTNRVDRIAYLGTMRQSMYRLLYVVDFTLAHDSVDRQMLRDARRDLVEGIDAADACLMLDDAHDLPNATG